MRETHGKYEAKIFSPEGAEYQQEYIQPTSGLLFGLCTFPPHFVRGYSDLVPSGQQLGTQSDIHF